MTSLKEVKHMKIADVKEKLIGSQLHLKEKKGEIVTVNVSDLRLEKIL